MPATAFAQDGSGAPGTESPDFGEPSQPKHAPAARPSPPTPGQVRYGAVDAATVRVFAVGAVELDTFELEGRRIQFAVTNAGHGTGFAVGSGRLVATARHVVEDAIHVVVRRPGDSGFSVAHVVYESQDADLTILATDEVMTPLKLADDATALRIRATAFAVGYPLDPTRKFAQSARGIIAGNLPDGTVQIDMDLNPGNSGGPLLDADDRVIGMVVARAHSQTGAQGIGYAVPIATITDAVRKAEVKLATSGAPRTTSAQLRSASVVDELVQAGALKSLRDASDLQGGLQGHNLERGLEGMSANVDDPDLLAFVSGNLWNASLVLRFGNIEKIGKNTLSKAEVHRLAGRFEREALELSKRAYERDPAIEKRSPFVSFARARHATHYAEYAERPPAGAWQTAGPPRRLPIRGWVGFNVRINPETGSTGIGGTGGLYMELRRTGDRKRVGRPIPVVGAAFGTTAVSAEMGTESFRHTYASAEIGAVVRVSNRFELGGVYAPALYQISLRDGAGEASSFVLGHGRVWASAVFGKVTISTSLRALSGPTFWLEPVTIGFIY